jgi:hypothetical protein
MVKQSDDSNSGSRQPPGREVVSGLRPPVVSGLRPPLQTPKFYAMYSKVVNQARKVVAIGMLIFAPGLILCANRNDYLRLTRT